MTIDGRTVSPIYGPYGGLYYSCPIGAWSGGSHVYTITATDSKGISATSSGTFLVTAASGSGSPSASVTATERAGLLATVMREMDDSGGCDDLLLDDLIGAA